MSNPSLCVSFPLRAHMIYLLPAPRERCFCTRKRALDAANENTPKSKDVGYAFLYLTFLGAQWTHDRAEEESLRAAAAVESVANEIKS